MFQGDNYRHKRMIKPIEKLYTQIAMAEQFLEYVNRILKECNEVQLDISENEGHEVCLLYGENPDDRMAIGYKDKGFYLLDADFIYRKHRVKHAIHIASKYGRTNFYEKLFRMRIIKPYRVSEKNKPLFKLCFNNETGEYRRCFCIPSKYVDFIV